MVVGRLAPLCVRRPLPARGTLGINDSGIVASGHRADLVLLDANPLVEISNTMRINAVMSNGTLYSRQALDEMLRQVEREAAAWNGIPTGQ